MRLGPFVHDVSVLGAEPDVIDELAADEKIIVSCNRSTISWIRERRSNCLDNPHSEVRNTETLSDFLFLFLLFLFTAFNRQYMHHNLSMSEVV